MVGSQVSPLSMSDPAERPAATAAKRKLHRLAEGALPHDELAALDELLLADTTEAHLRWLESGAEGPDPSDGPPTEPRVSARRRASSTS